MCNVQHGSFVEVDGYVPRGLGIGGGDYLEFAFCTECGMKHDYKYISPKEILEILAPTKDNEDE
jgi:hypothetical protein